jgi:hypothetical protein
MTARPGQGRARPGDLAHVIQVSRAAPRSGENYARWRARQMAYGQWEPWTLAGPVREHVQGLRRGGASLRAIGQVARVSPTTVHRLLHGEPARCRPAPLRMRTGEARRLLAVTPAAAERAAARRDASGARRRLRALTAVGYPAVSLAAQADVATGTVRDLVSGHTRTISSALHHAVVDIYDELWDQPPPENTGAQRRAAIAARRKAARCGWPTPMGLDDDQIDDPAYRPRSRWRPTAPACTAPPPSGRRIARHTRPGARHACVRSRGHEGCVG